MEKLLAQVITLLAFQCQACSPFGVKLLSAMTSQWLDDSSSAASMVGAAPSPGAAIDQYQWGRGALRMAKMDVQLFEHLACGRGAAACRGSSVRGQYQPLEQSAFARHSLAAQELDGIVEVTNAVQ